MSVETIDVGPVTADQNKPMEAPGVRLNLDQAEPMRWDATVHYLDGTTDSFSGLDDHHTEHYEHVLILSSGLPGNPQGKLYAVNLRATRYIEITKSRPGE